MSLLSNIESILFVASQPLTYKKIAKALNKQPADIEQAVETLMMKYNRDDSGIHLIVSDNHVQMGTNPNNAEAIDGFVKDEVVGELTKAQLETLTVVAYQSPITRPELEEIRGVNCSVILRNLLIRGLIVESASKDALYASYSLSVEALAHLGISSVTELPEYEQLSGHEYLAESKTD